VLFKRVFIITNLGVFNLFIIHISLINNMIQLTHQFMISGGINRFYIHANKININKMR